ncbi:MAG: hypothetical protein Q7T01_00085 [bacterium]|nr:hypothetical protein [bacterium]
MSSVLLMHTAAEHQHAASISQPIALLTPRRARFFALLAPVGDHQSAATSAYLDRIVTTMENIAGANDLLTAADGGRNAGDPEAWFAAYVQRIHAALAEHGPEGKQRRAFPMHAVIGITYHAQGRRAITVAAAGGMHVRLAARNAHGNVAIGDIITPEAPTVPLHFAHAMSGFLGPHDALLVGAAAAHEVLDDTIVRRALARQTMSDAAARIQQALRDATVPGTLLVVCGSSTKPADHSQASMESFIQTAALTEGFLTPRLGPSLRRYFVNARRTGTMIAAATVRPRRRHRGSRRAAAPRRILPAIVQAIRFAFQTVRVAVTSTLALVADAVRLIGIGTIRTIRGAQQLRATVRELPAVARGHAAAHENDAAPATAAARARDIIGNLQIMVPTPAHTRDAVMHAVRSARTQYRALPRQSQYLLVLAVGFGLLFTASTFALWRRNIAEADIASYNALIGRIEELRSVAEARLLFGDRDEARGAFVDATALAASLPHDSRARRERAARLEEELTSSLDRARLLTRIEQPLAVAASGALPFTTIRSTTVIGNVLVAIAPDATQVVTIEPKTGAITAQRVVPVPQLANDFRVLPFDDRSILLIDRNAEIALVNARTGAMTSASIASPPAAIRDAALFQQRLYLLHEDGSITRHLRTAGGFGTGTSWLRASDATALHEKLFVNGAAYAATRSGDLAQYLAGRRSDIDFAPHIDPPLRSTPLIAGAADAEILYLGVPTDGRIIALRDDGRLVGQLQSDAFIGMSALALAHDSASLFILANDTIYAAIPPTE